MSSGSAGIVFLDRDGVINRDRHKYVRSLDELVFLPGSLEAIARLNEAGFAIAVISNQACVAKGLLEMSVLEQIDQRIKEAARAAGGHIHTSCYCIHRSEDNCDCRKPKTGLIERARKEIGPVNGAPTFLVGDTSTDIEAGRRAGCKTVLVLSGHTSIEELNCWRDMPDLIAPDLANAVDWILSRS